MRFWDSSALVPLFVDERHSDRVQLWLKSDPDVTVWALTRVELMSMIARRERQFPGAAVAIQAARLRILDAWQRWPEIADLDRVRRQAERVVAIHPLRAADALKLGAALVAAEGDPSTLEFVTLDRRLADAAEREGFPVFGPD